MQIHDTAAGKTTAHKNSDLACAGENENIAQVGVTRMGRDAASGSVAVGDSTRSRSDAPHCLDRKDQHQ